MRNRRSDVEITTTVMTEQPVTVLRVAFYGITPDDLRLEGIMDALADEVLNTGLPHPDITRESHTVPVHIRSPHPKDMAGVRCDCGSPKCEQQWDLLEAAVRETGGQG